MTFQKKYKKTSKNSFSYQFFRFYWKVFCNNIGIIKSLSQNEKERKYFWLSSIFFFLRRKSWKCQCPINLEFPPRSWKKIFKRLNFIQLWSQSYFCWMYPIVQILKLLHGQDFCIRSGWPMQTFRRLTVSTLRSIYNGLSFIPNRQFKLILFD